MFIGSFSLKQRREMDLGSLLSQSSPPLPEFTSSPMVHLLSQSGGPPLPECTSSPKVGALLSQSRGRPLSECTCSPKVGALLSQSAPPLPKWGASSPTVHALLPRAYTIHKNRNFGMNHLPYYQAFLLLNFPGGRGHS